MAATDRQVFFTKNLLAWHAGHHRPMPWKGERNPYLIWLSEIILQQTRVEQGLPYFERFKATYPTVTDLANAPEDEVMKLWEGLGYYSRARNLHAAAKHIAHDLNGSFPATYEGIRSLKGVGDYTAAAIASFAYDLPHAVVDGNVYRVLSRYFGIETPIDSTAGKKEFAALAQGLMEIRKLGNWWGRNFSISQFQTKRLQPGHNGLRRHALYPGCAEMWNLSDAATLRSFFGRKNGGVACENEEAGAAASVFQLPDFQSGGRGFH